ncbi:unnamed protein product [marine sediment metagenome]|uniref:Uncharacterized protein n=1 Tax=marine sediment metagenome TaxID=412755 RepID=X1PCU3_9ZZZZ
MQNNPNTKMVEDNVSLRNIIEKDLIKIIKGLSSEELLNAYRSLSGLKTKINNNLRIREKNYCTFCRTDCINERGPWL